MPTVLKQTLHQRTSESAALARSLGTVGRTRRQDGGGGSPILKAEGEEGEKKWMFLITEIKSLEFYQPHYFICAVFVLPIGTNGFSGSVTAAESATGPDRYVVAANDETSALDFSPETEHQTRLSSPSSLLPACGGLASALPNLSHLFLSLFLFFFFLHLRASDTSFDCNPRRAV